VKELAMSTLNALPLIAFTLLVLCSPFLFDLLVLVSIVR
jgi:hypothetical protein